jgi:hypothetical protein
MVWSIEPPVWANDKYRNPIFNPASFAQNAFIESDVLLFLSLPIEINLTNPVQSIRIIAEKITKKINVLPLLFI